MTPSRRAGFTFIDLLMVVCVIVVSMVNLLPGLASRAYPNGVLSSSPGLAASGGLPWVSGHTNDFYPNGVASAAPR